MYTDNNNNNPQDNNFNDFNDNQSFENNSGVDNDFYKYENQQYEMDNKPKKSKKVILWIIIALIILIALFGSLAFFYFRNNNSGTGGSGTEQPVLTPNLVLNITEFSLKVNNTKKIEYTIENDNGNVLVTWNSSDTKIATVDNTGTVKGVKDGTATITASYTIDGQTYEKTCTVTVVKDSSSGNGGNTGGSGSSGTTADKTDPKLSISFTKGKENTWVNTDVVIKTTASDNSGSVTVEYALNCTIGTCEYKKVSNNTITISSEGPTEVKIRAKDKAGNDATRNVTVRIDKTKPTCSLNIAEDGTLTAENVGDKGGSELSYKGFSSTYSGTSETTKKITKAETYTYYVKDKAGNTNTCSLDVKTKTQYRYQDCTSCQAKCDYVWIKQNNYDECANGGDNYKIENGNCMERFCTNYDKCGTCLAYGQFSAWSDKSVTKTPERNVETKTVYYK